MQVEIQQGCGIGLTLDDSLTKPSAPSRKRKSFWPCQPAHRRIQCAEIVLPWPTSTMRNNKKCSNLPRSKLNIEEGATLHSASQKMARTGYTNCKETLCIYIFIWLRDSKPFHFCHCCFVEIEYRWHRRIRKRNRLSLLGFPMRLHILPSSFNEEGSQLLMQNQLTRTGTKIHNPHINFEYLWCALAPCDFYTSLLTIYIYVVSIKATEPGPRPTRFKTLGKPRSAAMMQVFWTVPNRSTKMSRAIELRLGHGKRCQALGKICN